MKKTIITCAIATALFGQLFAQPITTQKKPTKDWSKVDLSNRPTDHIVIQYGADNWGGAPDSIHIGGGFSRFFNMYVMIDKPFKKDPRYSVGYGVGIGSSNIFFENTLIDIAGKKSTNSLLFQNASAIDHYKKYKLTAVWAEIPLELRYTANPEKGNASWKVAVGGKIGTLINVHTKGKQPINASGADLNGQTKTIEKVNNRKFFNPTRIAATLRIGYGAISLYGAYQINSFVKDGVGPQVFPYSIGVCLSGL